MKRSYLFLGMAVVLACAFAFSVLASGSNRTVTTSAETCCCCGPCCPDGQAMECSPAEIEACASVCDASASTDDTQCGAIVAGCKTESACEPAR